MKEYPLYIQCCIEFEGSSVVNYYSKGHHDKQQFLDAIKGDYEYVGKLEEVRHSYAKCISTPTGGTFLYDKLNPCKGSFPITIIDTY